MRRYTIEGAKRRAQRYWVRGRQMLGETISTGKIPRRERNVLPCDYHKWASRFDGRRDAGFPDSWRIHPDIPLRNPARLAVITHVFYPELLPEIIEHLKNIPLEFDLIITNASKEKISPEPLRKALDKARNVLVLKVENHGRDIFPLVQVINAGLIDNAELVIKIHTKKSAWRASHDSLAGDGAQWKDEFLRELLGSPERITSILNYFAANPRAGMLTAAGNIVGPEHWGGDRHIVEELLRRLELEIEPSALRFPAGSMYVTRAFVLQGLRALCLSAEDFEEEAGQIDATAAHAIERILGIVTEEAGLRIVDTSVLSTSESSDNTDDDAAATAADADGYTRFAADAPRHAAATVIPFYLPQFHPNAENDRWWGEGFTEWTNVTAARPVFAGHHQPRLPADLGFYDLRLDEVRWAQHEMAMNAGIAGFMYYYYWFAGKRLLNLPIEKMVASDVPTPFCLMWANENWTRRWDGRESDILVGQDYDEVPAEEFIDDILEFLSDSRYMRIDGKCVLAVYRPAQMEDFASVLTHWRKVAREAGLGELYVLAVEVAEQFDGLGKDWDKLGLDGTLMFPPHNLPWAAGPFHKVMADWRFQGNFMHYGKMADAAIERFTTLGPGQYPGVMVTFDNTARRQWQPDIWWGSNPYTFHRWLRAGVEAVLDREVDERVVFVNAWNEWAEGAVLEPTQRHGSTYLQAVRNVLYS